MIPLSLERVADVVSARTAGTDPAARVTGSVTTDSRTAGPGDLYVALVGERVDGHDFAAAAVAAGAVAVLGSRVVPGAPCLVV